MPEGPLLVEGNLIRDCYRVLGLIGGGAMSRVYKVEHIELGTLHALKQIATGEEEEPGRFDALLEIAKREAHFLTTLSHPGLPKVTDFIHDGNNIYLIMDYVQGQNLKLMLEGRNNQGMDVPTVLRWAVQISDILAYLHSQKPPIIFRDVKPANLIRQPDDRIMLVDFGIAREVRKGATTDTAILGSPGYAPPEQYGQHQTDARSDIYALGATLHHLLTGRDPSISPFQWPPVRSLNPEVPLVLEKLVMRCLELDPNRRPESAESLSKKLRTIQEMVEEAYTHKQPIASLDYHFGDTNILPRYALDLPQMARGSGTIPMLGEEAPTVAAPRPTFIPASMSTPAPPPLTVLPPPPKPLHEVLYRFLFGMAAVILLCILLLPLLNSGLAPALPNLSLPQNPGTYAPVEQRTAYLSAITDYQTLQQQAQRALNNYNNLMGVRYLLGVLVLGMLGIGTLLPRRPTRAGMTLTVSGLLCLIGLTGAFFLPDRLSLFLPLLLLEALLLIPALLLLSAELAA